jgi:RPA family protein
MDSGTGFFNVENDNNDNKYGNNNNTKGGFTGYNDGEKKKPKMFVPMTLSMLINTEKTSDDHFEVDGENINDIIIVGRVFDKESHPTRTTFMINDNTGCMKVNIYNKEENVLPEYMNQFEKVFTNECYVKIFGSIRMFKENKAIVGTHLHVIEDYDEITNHLLQVFIASCVRRKGILAGQDLTDKPTEGQAVTMNEAQIKQAIIDTLQELAQNTSKSEFSKEEIHRKLKSKVAFPVFEKVTEQMVDDMELFSGEGGGISKV